MTYLDDSGEKNQNNKSGLTNQTGKKKTDAIKKVENKKAGGVGGKSINAPSLPYYQKKLDAAKSKYNEALTKKRKATSKEEKSLIDKEMVALKGEIDKREADKAGARKEINEFRENKKKNLAADLQAAGIKDPKLQAMIFAQATSETLDFTRMREDDFTYSNYDNFKRNFGNGRTDAEIKKAFNIKGESDAEKSEKADFMYGKKNGNKNKGDGFKYRGRGYIHLTGRGEYEAMMGYLKDDFHINVDLINNPDLVADPNYAGKIAISYFKHRKVNDVISKSGKYKNEDEMVDAATKIINSGMLKKDERRKNYKKYYDAIEKEKNVSGVLKVSALTGNARPNLFFDGLENKNKNEIETAQAISSWDDDGEGGNAPVYSLQAEAESAGSYASSNIVPAQKVSASSVQVPANEPALNRSVKTDYAPTDNSLQQLLAALLDKLDQPIPISVAVEVQNGNIVASVNTENSRKGNRGPSA